MEAPGSLESVAMKMKRWPVYWAKAPRSKGFSSDCDSCQGRGLFWFQ